MVLLRPLWIICTREHLENVNLHGMNNRNVFFSLESNIDLGSKAFHALGSSLPFMGSFDGNNYEISNLNSEAGASGGLFINLSGARIVNLKIRNARINTESQIIDNVGILSSMMSEDTRITNVHILGNNHINGRTSLGAFAGVADGNGFILESSVSGLNVTSNQDYTALSDKQGVGGIVGTLKGWFEVKSSNIDTSVLHANNSVGGIVGLSMGGSSVVDSSAHNIRIETSGNGEAIGGAVGRVMRGKSYR